MEYYERKVRMRTKVLAFVKAATKIGGITATELDINIGEFSMGKKSIISYLDELIELNQVRKVGNLYFWNEKEAAKKEAEDEFDKTMKNIGAIPKDD